MTATDHTSRPDHRPRKAAAAIVAIGLVATAQLGLTTVSQQQADATVLAGFGSSPGAYDNHNETVLVDA